MQIQVHTLDVDDRSLAHCWGQTVVYHIDIFEGVPIPRAPWLEYV